MTDLERRAREMLSEDSGPDDLSWEDSPDNEQQAYMMQAAEERALSYQLSHALFVRFFPGQAPDSGDVAAYSRSITEAMQVAGVSLVSIGG